MDLTLSDFTAQLASAQPAPGGGGAAALTCGANDRWFQDIRDTGEPDGQGPPRIKFLHRPLAMYPCIRVRPCLTVRASILFS